MLTTLAGTRLIDLIVGALKSNSHEDRSFLLRPCPELWYWSCSRHVQINFLGDIYLMDISQNENGGEPTQRQRAERQGISDAKAIGSALSKDHLSSLGCPDGLGRILSHLIGEFIVPLGEPGLYVEQQRNEPKLELHSNLVENSLIRYLELFWLQAEFLSLEEWKYSTISLEVFVEHQL